MSADCLLAYVSPVELQHALVSAYISSVWAERASWPANIGPIGAHCLLITLGVATTGSQFAFAFSNKGAVWAERACIARNIRTVGT